MDRQAEISYLKTLSAKIKQDDCTGLAAEIVYHWLLSLIPILLFILTLFGLFNQTSDFIYSLIGDLSYLLPPSAYELVLQTVDEVTRGSSGGLALISIAGALWTGSNGAVIIMKALNRAYDCNEDSRPFWRKRLVAMLIVLGMAVILMVCSNLIVIGNVVLDWLRPVYPEWRGWLVAIDVSRWLVIAISLAAISGFIYTKTPNMPCQPSFRAVWPGVLTFVASWYIISWLFSVYVSHMGRFNAVYGSMGALVIFMIWLYFTSLAFLVGGEINALNFKHSQESRLVNT